MVATKAQIFALGGTGGHWRNHIPARSPDASPSSGRRAAPADPSFGRGIRGGGAHLRRAYLAAGAPTPLLVVFQQEWRFAPWVLTVAFATYAIGLLAALLVAGQLSDYAGRRPVLIVALAVELLSMLMFVFAPGIGWVIAARAVQGIATGAATSAFTASIVEHAPVHRKRLATIIGSVAPAGGLGIGALLTGVAVQFTQHASLIVFAALAVVMAAGAAVTALSAETATPRPGAVRSLVPQVAVPRAARREFTAAVPVHLAAWMLSGLFLGLGPTIIQDLFGLHSRLLNGATAFVLPETAAVAAFSLAGSTPADHRDRRGLRPHRNHPHRWRGRGENPATAVAGRPDRRCRVRRVILWCTARDHPPGGNAPAGLPVRRRLRGRLPQLRCARRHRRLLVAPAGLPATVLGYGVAIILAASAGGVAQIRSR